MSSKKINRTNIFSAAAQKLLCYPDKLQAWLNGEPFVPITLEIHPTERCNHRCPQCQSTFAMPSSEARKRARQGQDLDLHLLDSVWRDPPEGVVLSGHTGDPLLHPQICELLEQLERVGMPVALVTNGEAITEEIAQLAVRVCTGSRVSIDAYDPASFRKTHGVGEDSWKRVLNGIELLVRARAEAKMSREDFMVGVGYLTDEQTKAGMLKATQLAKRLKVDYIQFRPFHYRASSIDAELKACRALEDSPRFRVIASFQKYDLADSSTRTPAACHGSMFFTVIDARGDCYVCCHHVAREEAKIGSLAEMSWQELIASERRKKLAYAFPTKYCIPECRLSPHNAFLQEILESKVIPPSTASEEIRRHSGFL